MFAPLKHLLGLIFWQGNLAARDAAGCVHTFGDGSGPRIAIAFKSRRLEWRTACDPELAAGEGYMQGSLVMEAGDIYDFLELAMRNMARRPLPRWTIGLARLRQLRHSLDEVNSIGRAARNASVHYDIDPRIYDLFLDTQRQYSCAYFAPGIYRLEDAQAAKMRHIAAKLLLTPGLEILDLGCGWGGLARYLAAHGNARVHGITLSTRQLQAARRQSAPRHGSCTFSFDEYRTVKGPFDRIVSVGMFEHVGAAHYDTYFARIAALLRDDGVALVHAIGRLDGPCTTNPFVAKWIFPGGALPALSEVTAAVEKSGLIMTDVEILRLHYAETLRQWRRRFLLHAAEAERIAGPRFVRMWNFYLAGCEAAFRHQLLMVFQLQLAKRIDTVPLTRDYIMEAEWRLAQGAGPAVRPLSVLPFARKQKS
jgi:cyclopropane-fatty-acyl-phospholipid synthase